VGKGKVKRHPVTAVSGDHHHKIKIWVRNGLYWLIVRHDSPALRTAVMLLTDPAPLCF
jgi:hypothetical protein